MFYKILELYVTCFKIGYIPFGPGTFGSLLSLCLWFLIVNNSLFIKILLISIFFIIGVFASEIISKKNNEKDPGYIIIDELIGMWITLLLIPYGFNWYFLGFLFFRIFDIIKLYPANIFDKMNSGVGIMLDDVVAGLYAGISVQIIWIFS